MGNIAGVLKAEIARVSRKEIKAAVKQIAKTNASLRRTVADLKRRLLQVERDNKRLRGRKGKEPAVKPEISSDESKGARLTSKGIRSLRRKLGLGRPDFARLVGTSAQTVYTWERKEGALKLRGNTRAAILSVRDMGVREAKQRLESAD
jgi:DNA-binding transcriptional regulator YiaG